ncbi:MAG: DUF5666 domain-containing protein [Lysobacterales bacterium]
MNTKLRSRQIPALTMLLGGLLTWSATALAQPGNLDLNINGRPYSLADGMTIEIDGEAATAADLLHRPNGLQARWLDAPTPVTDGAVPGLVFSYSLIGPVTDSEPLSILGQALTITADTNLAGLTAPVSLPLGTPLLVAGLVDSNGSVLASLVELRTAAGNKYLLTGSVQALGAQPSLVRIGQQWIDAGALPFTDCPGGVASVGDVLSVRANVMTGFQPGDTIDTVVDLRCVTLVPPGTVAAAGFLQGLVTTPAPTPGQFQLGGLGVQYDAQTVFLFGNADDLAEGVAVTVDGNYLDPSSFAAAAVEFVRPVVRFEAPMSVDQVVPGVSVSPFGVAVLGSAQLRDQDGILANGLSQATQVEVRGWLDGVGQAYASRVRSRGNPDASRADLRGPVETIADPLLSIQTLSVDTTGALFFDDLKSPITREQFFAALQVGFLVDVGGAQWNPLARSLTGGDVTLIGAVAPVAARRADLAGTGNISGTASGYALPDSIFSGGFENSP